MSTHALYRFTYMSKYKPAYGLFLLALFTAACSGSEIVSRQPERVVITAEDADELSDASEEAAEYCEHNGRRAVLDRTEANDDGLLVYYNCQ